MRTLIMIVAVFVGFAVVGGSAPIQAAAEPAHGGDTKGHSEAGKPDVKKDFGITRYDLGIYTLIVFLILVVVLGKFAWGPMMQGLDKREAALKKTFDDAESARAESAKALAEVQARLVKANDEVRAMLDEARRDAQAVRDQMKADAASEIQAERERIRREIETARDAALQDIYQQSVQLAAMISSRAVKRELTPADHARLLDEALADLKTNLTSRT